MSAINANISRQKQTESSEAVNEAINDTTLSNIADATQGADDDGTTHKGEGKAGKGKKAPTGIGAKGHHGHNVGNIAGDKIDSNASSQQAADGSSISSKDPLGTSADQQAQSAATQDHFQEVSDLATPAGNDASASTKKSAASTSTAATQGTASAAATPDETATNAQQALSQVLASPSATTSQVNKATDTMISAMRADGATDAQITTKLTQLTSAPSASAINAASALVEAAKNGINTDTSNDDKAAALVQQKQLDKKRDAANAAQQAAAQQAANSGGGGGGYDSGNTDGGSGADGDSSSAADTNYSGTGQSGGTAADTPAKAPTSQQVMSMDELKSKVPARLAKLFPTIEAAAQKYNLQPQLLVAIAMQESTGGTDQSAYSNGGGMFQFTDAGTWSQYGSGSRMDDQASAWACAKYMAANINNAGGNLNAALREYNGPVGQGGLASYQSDIYKKMMGQDLGN